MSYRQQVIKPTFPISQFINFDLQTIQACLNKLMKSVLKVIF